MGVQLVWEGNRKEMGISRNEGLSHRREAAFLSKVFPAKGIECKQNRGDLGDFEVLWICHQALKTIP